MTRSILVSTLLLAACSFGISSCIIHADPMFPPPVGVVIGPPVEYGYQPLLYNGYVVYHSHEGVPFYWANGYQVWLPVHLRPRYVTHWNSHRKAYGIWHSKRGHAYRTHRFHKKKQRIKAKKSKRHHHHEKSRKARKPRRKHRD